MSYSIVPHIHGGSPPLLRIFTQRSNTFGTTTRATAAYQNGHLSKPWRRYLTLLDQILAGVAGDRLEAAGARSGCGCKMAEAERKSALCDLKNQRAGVE
jgi:hypothetical protein